MSLFTVPFSKNQDKPSKIVTVKVFQVQLPVGTSDEVHADVMSVTEGGALVLYKITYLGKAGSYRTAVKAYGVGQWISVQRTEVLRTS